MALESVLFSPRFEATTFVDIFDPTTFELVESVELTGDFATAGQVLFLGDLWFITDSSSIWWAGSYLNGDMVSTGVNTDGLPPVYMGGVYALANTADGTVVSSIDSGLTFAPTGNTTDVKSIFAANSTWFGFEITTFEMYYSSDLETWAAVTLPTAFTWPDYVNDNGGIIGFDGGLFMITAHESLGEDPSVTGNGPPDYNHIVQILTSSSASSFSSVALVVSDGIAGPGDASGFVTGQSEADDSVTFWAWYTDSGGANYDSKIYTNSALAYVNSPAGAVEHAANGFAFGKHYWSAGGTMYEVDPVANSITTAPLGIQGLVADWRTIKAAMHDFGTPDLFWTNKNGCIESA